MSLTSNDPQSVDILLNKETKPNQTLWNDVLPLFRLVTDELTNRYQEKLPGEGSDLVATIIQRSRDHGLPVYLAWLMFCGFKTPMDFSGLPHHDAAAKRKLSSMYV